MEREAKEDVRKADHKIVYGIERVRHGINNFFDDVGKAVKSESDTADSKRSAEAKADEAPAKM